MSTILRACFLIFFCAVVVVSGSCGRNTQDQRRLEQPSDNAQPATAGASPEAGPHTPRRQGGTVSPQLLQGSIGVSSEYMCGWLDLASVTDFYRGETLKLRIGGSAKRILLRLLPQNIDPNSRSGIVGGPLVVPEGGQVVVMLEENHSSVKQISVHGGPNPFGLYPLGGGNGPATLISVTHIPKP